MSTYTKDGITFIPDLGKVATSGSERRYIADMVAHNHGHAIGLLVQQDKADGERLANCWNACLGIENPQEALRMAREALQNMLDLQDQMGIHETPDHYTEYLESTHRALAALGPQPTATEEGQG